MSDQAKSFANLFPWEDNTPVAGGLRQLMRVLDQLLLPAVNSKADYDQAIAAFRNILLLRFQEQIQPIFDEITSVASLGAIFSTASATRVQVGLGLRSFTVDQGSRQIFAASPYLAVVSLADGKKSMTGVLASYDRVSGQLVINVLTATGVNLYAQDWYISACPPPYVPQAIDGGRIEDTPDGESVSFVFFREDQGNDKDGYV